MNTVTAVNLSKTYPQGKKALDNISFALNKGEVFGFLGPNGAGKTTTVKLLNGMLKPSKGNCTVFGIDSSLSPEKIHQLSGVVTEHAQMYDNLTGTENLIFYGTLFGISKSDSKNRAEFLLEKLGLKDAAKQKLNTYSTGMRQRLSLARAMVHRPSILFLDEPTSGLDPESVHSVNQLIKNLAKDEGTTIFLCTHQLRYAQEICTSYGLIDEGKLLACGNIEKLRSMVFSGIKVNIKANRLPSGLPVTKKGDQCYEITVNSEEEIPAVIKRIVEGGGDVYHVLAHRLSLEEIYFSLIEQQKSKEALK